MDFESRRARRRARLARAMLRAAFAGGIALLCMTALRAPAAVPALPSRAAVPSAFHGVWQPDTRKGRAACASYRKAPSGSDEAMWALAGALIVSAHTVHEVSDMGEGNFISADHVVTERDAVLRIDGRLGIDTGPDESSDPITLRLRRNGDTLELRETYDGTTTKSAYRYCATRPRG